MKDLLQLLAEYEVWADAQLIDSLKTIAAQPDGGIQKVLAHAVVAKENWLDRLDGIAATAPLWPQWPLEECVLRLKAADHRLLDRVPAVVSAPDRIVEYRTSAGVPQSTPVRILWMHLINHGTYHRGQLATTIKAAGGQPAVTDIIAWHRAGCPAG